MKNFLVVFFLATAVLFTACSDDDDDENPPVVVPTGSLVVEDQTLMNGMVTISSIEISDDGWVAIYRDNAGALGTEVLGFTHVEDGTHEDVVVELDESVVITGEEILWAALHVDEDDDGVFDWNGITGTDVLIRSGVDLVAEPFTVYVETETTTAGEN